MEMCLVPRRCCSCLTRDFPGGTLLRGGGGHAEIMCPVCTELYAQSHDVNHIWILLGAYKGNIDFIMRLDRGEVGLGDVPWTQRAYIAAYAGVLTSILAAASATTIMSDSDFADLEPICVRCVSCGKDVERGGRVVNTSATVVGARVVCTGCRALPPWSAELGALSPLLPTNIAFEHFCADRLPGAFTPFAACARCAKPGSACLSCIICRARLYCSAECRIKNWSVHKTSCTHSANLPPSDGAHQSRGPAPRQ